jgi:hypothetical protein
MGAPEPSEQETERYARFTRLCASPQSALAIDEVERQVDVRAILPQIQVPTLVMSTRGDNERGEWAPGSWIAEQIPGARHVEIPDNEHFPVRPDVYRDFELFLSQIQEQERIFDRDREEETEERRQSIQFPVRAIHRELNRIGERCVLHVQHSFDQSAIRSATAGRIRAARVAGHSVTASEATSGRAKMTAKPAHGTMNGIGTSPNESEASSS